MLRLEANILRLFTDASSTRDVITYFFSSIPPLSPPPFRLILILRFSSSSPLNLLILHFSPFTVPLKLLFFSFIFLFLFFTVTVPPSPYSYPPSYCCFSAFLPLLEAFSSSSVNLFLDRPKFPLLRRHLFQNFITWFIYVT